MHESRVSKHMPPETSAPYRRQQRLYLSTLVRGVHVPPLGADVGAAAETLRCVESRQV